MNYTEVIDKNLRVQTNINKADIKFYDAKEAPFKIYGVKHEDGQFRRMPGKVAETVSDGVKALHKNTCGGRVRFVTDSSYIAISAKMPYILRLPHSSLTGLAGFDMYVSEDGEKEYYNNTFVPPIKMTDGYESVFDFGEAKEREITINFPLYSDVSELYIGLSESAKISEARNYENVAPIVYYGHSITQGGCASRPGNCPSHIIGRRLGRDFINLGFSGYDLGEIEMADYIASLDMSLFVYDYVNNAPSVEHLRRTHKPFFEAVRRAHPEIPIIFMTSTVRASRQRDRDGRHAVIYDTYREAVESGDKNVYFLDGAELFDEYQEWGTVEGLHPNDFGFFHIARVLGDLIEKIINEEK